MKRSRLSYDEWKCITAKALSGRQVHTDFFTGYIGLMDIQVNSPMIFTVLQP